MLLFSALVAGSFALGSRVANDISPTALTALRFWIAVVIIGFVVRATTGISRNALQSPWRYLVLGALFSVYFVLMFEGLKTAPPVSAAAVFTLTPVIAAVAGWWLLGQITTPRMALALTIGGVGALWVIFRADFAAFRAFEVGGGEVIYFFGCVAHAIYTPMVRKLNRGEPAVVFTLGTLIAGAVMLTAIAWPDLRATEWSELSPLVWVTIFYLALFATALSFVLVQAAALRLPSAKVMAYTYLTPSWVICWELALCASPPPFLIMAGIAMTVFALLLLLRDEEAVQTA